MNKKIRLPEENNPYTSYLNLWQNGTYIKYKMPQPRKDRIYPFNKVFKVFILKYFFTDIRYKKNSLEARILVKQTQTS